MDLLQDPRYTDTPVYLFFEKYVLDVIGQLPPEKDEILKNIDLQSIFDTQATNWRDVVREVLQLSNTIDIAILNHWYRKQDEAQTLGYEVNSNHFSKEFVDLYFEEESNVDVWTEESLNEAKQFILKNQQLESA